MSKSSYKWIWKWHFIGGLVSFPVVLILALTGIIYLFKDQYEQPRYSHIKTVAVGTERLSYQKQWQIAQEQWAKQVKAMVLPDEANEATEFVSGRFSRKSSLFVNPYSGKVTGQLAVKDSDMFKVRKLHGELLTGSAGTKIVELVGSWLIVLILSGLVLFFPRKSNDWIKLFRIRFRSSRQVLYRDLHMVGGFWFSIVLLLILAGGMPWTDVWGAGFKWVQKQTGTGHPPSWQGQELSSKIDGDAVTLDEVAAYIKSKHLPGEVTITLPQSPDGIFSVHNIYHQDQSQQIAIHIDQYSGQEIASLQWSDVGLLMRGRMWAMAFHQGQFGMWNWILVLVTAAGLLALSSAAVASFFLRKRPNSWMVPRKDSYHVGLGFYLLILGMGIFLPLFGLSVIAILMVELINRLARGLRKAALTPN
ncbi:MAG: PepSY domain-containing protein [Cyclobacteriaceae bacterium]|nr:PepSY domain-containing protein [Cyclobacteriaceae bacterium HetDA_MAG_MS6]